MASHRARSSCSSRRVSGLLIASLTLASAANAATITPGNVGSLVDYNVLFNESGLTQTGLLVQGITNQNPGFVIDFTSTTELKTVAGGQARIVTLADDGTFTDVTTYMDDVNSTFKSIVFLLDVTTDGTADVKVYDALNNLVLNTTVNLDRHGNNFFTVQAGGGESLTKLVIDNSTPISSYQQIRVGGSETTDPPVVPSPAAAGAGGLLIAGLAGRKLAGRMRP